MNPPMQLPLHLIVTGAAIVTLGLRPAAHVDASVRVAAPKHAATSVLAFHVHKGHHRTPPRPVRTVASTRVSGAAAPTGPTGWSALNRAIARIPSYRPGTVRWVMSSKFGHWGTTDWYHATAYISPAVPSTYMYDVAVHEWSHELTVLDYHGDVAAATAATNRAFGGGGLVGEERAADCMAILQGATWTHYTSCTSPRWRHEARRLLEGERL